MTPSEKHVKKQPQKAEATLADDAGTTDAGDNPGTHAGVPRLVSGVPRLDDILKGGFLRGGMYGVLGPPGSGKTILGNQVCFEHARRGHRAVYITLLAESHARMLSHLRSIDFFKPDLVGPAICYVSGFAALEQKGLEGLQEFLRRVVREHRATFLVVDGLQAVEAYAETTLAFQKFLRELQAYTSSSSAPPCCSRRRAPSAGTPRTRWSTASSS